MVEQAVLRKSVETALDTLRFTKSISEDSFSDLSESEEDFIKYYEEITPEIMELVNDSETFDRAVTLLLLSLDFVYTMTGRVAAGTIFDTVSETLTKGKDGP